MKGLYVGRCVEEQNESLYLNIKPIEWWIDTQFLQKIR